MRLFSKNNTIDKTKSIIKYKEFIDGLVLQKNDVKSKWVKNKSYPETDNNKKINKFLSELSDNQREILADMLNDSRIGGIHDTLAYIDNLMDTNRMDIKIDSVPIYNNEFESMHFDFICRCNNDKWPDENLK